MTSMWKLRPVPVFVLGALVMSHALAEASTPSYRQATEGVIFEQPSLPGIVTSFFVPLAEHAYPAKREFNVILWQPNPSTLNGELISTSWKVGDMTGFYPAAPLSEHQAGFRDAPGSSAAQIDGATIGAYINSIDLRRGSNGDKMMITPALKPRSRTFAFINAGMMITNELELQVPVAQDNNKPGNFSYVSPIFVFQDRLSGTRISYGINLFHHALKQVSASSARQLEATEIGPFDAPSHSFQVNNPIEQGSRILTVAQGSSLRQIQPWRGWRRFAFAITQANFVRALSDLKERVPAFGGSQHPSDYFLFEWHLNAEITFASGPSALGWSMRKAKITIAAQDPAGPSRH